MARRTLQLQQATSPVGTFVRIVLKILGILFLVTGLAALGREIRSIESIETASGKIIDARVIKNGDHDHYAPVVEFSSQDGRVVHFQGHLTSRKPVEGVQVTVLYDKSKPEAAKIDDFVERWLFPSIAIPIGMLMILGAWWSRNYF